MDRHESSESTLAFMGIWILPWRNIGSLFFVLKQDDGIISVLFETKITETVETLPFIQEAPK